MNAVSKPIVIQYNEPLPRVELTHPCMLGEHKWAWLARGGVECVLCGKRM